jgi:hypothetical protein
MTQPSAPLLDAYYILHSCYQQHHSRTAIAVLGLGLLQDRDVEDGVLKREWKSLLSASALDNGC